MIIKVGGLEPLGPIGVYAYGQQMSYFKAKCTKFDFGWGSAKYPAGGAYSAPTEPLAEFKWPTSKGEKGRGREERA